MASSSVPFEIVREPAGVNRGVVVVENYRKKRFYVVGFSLVDGRPYDRGCAVFEAPDFQNALAHLGALLDTHPDPSNVLPSCLDGVVLHTATGQGGYAMDHLAGEVARAYASHTGRIN